MAKGSEKLTWLQLGGKRPCDGCGAVLKVDEVAVHTGPVIKVFCKQCLQDGSWLK